MGPNNTSAVVEIVAFPLPFRVPVPREVEPSKNFTVPVGTPLPGAVAFDRCGEGHRLTKDLMGFRGRRDNSGRRRASWLTAHGETVRCYWWRTCYLRCRSR